MLSKVRVCPFIDILKGNIFALVLLRSKVTAAPNVIALLVVDVPAIVPAVYVIFDPE